MNEIKTCNDLSINKYGTIGSLMNGYIESYLNEDEVETINKKIDILNSKLENLIVKALSEETDDFIEIAVDLLNMSEDNFENIIDGFMKLTQNDIDVLYYNLWKKRGNEKFDVNSLKKEIGSNYEFVPDLIMSYEYRVNKDDFVNNENSIIIGESLTLMPTQESSNIFNIFEKLSYNNFIKLSKYIPNKMSESFNTYLCFTFTYLGIHLCRIMEKIEKNKKEKMKNE